jgi:hypothetical protein
VFSDLRWKVVIWFVDLGRIVAFCHNSSIVKSHRWCNGLRAYPECGRLWVRVQVGSNTWLLNWCILFYPLSMQN